MEPLNLEDGRLFCPTCGKRECNLNDPSDVGVDEWECPYCGTDFNVPAGTRLRSKIELRPEVCEFALSMERRLRANDHKPGWKEAEPDWLYLRLMEQKKQLESALRWQHKTRAVAAATDIANYSMMIADIMAAKVSSDIFLECSGCGKVVTWGDYEQNHAMQDHWQDGGEDAYCPDCADKPSLHEHNGLRWSDTFSGS